MRGLKSFLSLVLPLTLFALLVVFGMLQYRWLGQVSDAERADLRASLERRGHELAADIDREVSTFQRLVATVPRAADEADPEELARAIASWRREARHPGLFGGLYFGVRGGVDASLFLYDESRSAFTATPWPMQWPDELRSARRLRQPAPDPPAAGSRGGEFVTFRSPTVLADPLLYVVWLPTRVDLDQRSRLPAGVSTPGPRPEERFVAIVLDRTAFTEAVLPDLVGRHFGSDRIRVAVLDDLGRALYTSDGPEGTPAIGVSPDARVPFLVGFAGLPDAPGANNVFTWATRLVGSDLAQPAETDGHSAVALQIERRTFGVGDVSIGPGRPWQVLLQHEVGSVDAAVSAGRRRNLWLSFGILSVLAAGMALVVVNARRAERLAAQQVDFVAAVSHELRTPLTVMRTAAQNLSSGIVRDVEHTRKYGDLIEQEGRRLTEMVEQVLGYAGIDALGRGARTSDVDVRALVASVVDSHARALADSGMVVEVADSGDIPAVSVDEAALRRALQNVISNAMKYAAAGGWIGLHLEHSTLRGRPAVSIRISDRGSGIPAADLPHVFEPFYRGQSAVERQIHGSGIGLSLVKKVADAHGGHVAVESSPGGTTFVLTIPVGRSESAADPGGQRV